MFEEIGKALKAAIIIAICCAIFTGILVGAVTLATSYPGTFAVILVFGALGALGWEYRNG